MSRPALLIVSLALACASDKPAPEPGGSHAAQTAAGAMCAEHGVLEAICTKCNPKLIPVFQAKGDWCEEHGFPESVCPICHPERGGKPAADVGVDGAPPDGTKVRLQTADIARRAGIETVKAQARPGGARLEAVATLLYDPTRQAVINARSPGVVRALLVDVGTRVEAGQILAELDSAGVGADRSRLAAGSARLKVAEEAYRRERELFDQGISPRKDVLAAEQELEAARAERSSAAAALGVVGGGGGAGRYRLTAPIGGVVVRRSATLGHMVTGDEALFEVVDTSKMVAEIDVPEAELGSVAPGQMVELTVDTIADRTFGGPIQYVAPEVDRSTRTAKARVALENPDGILRANMFATAQVALGQRRTTVMVPRAAVQRAKEVAFVFVKTGPTEFEARRVKTGLDDAEAIELVTGVVAGEEVATRGSFFLKTETLKGEIGAGCCD